MLKYINVFFAFRFSYIIQANRLIKHISSILLRHVSTYITCFFILIKISFEVGVLLPIATLSIGTKTFVSG